MSDEWQYTGYSESRWLEFDQLGTELVYPCTRRPDGSFEEGPSSDSDPDLREVLLDRSDVTIVWPCDNLVEFIKARLPEMTIIDRSMAPLLEGYDTPEREAPPEAIIEVWLAPDLEEPEQTFEDFILDTLMETELGVVGEYADMKDYRFASCDVSDPAKAARALLKAFKKAGYTTGIEIKERDGKKRVWKLG